MLFAGRALSWGARGKTGAGCLRGGASPLVTSVRPGLRRLASRTL
ncbi:hypothetical protein BQ8420_18710 [Nocardiopsis sp. JB363]|nr:hypothetical protein BQ8420_18710 [Nocardiopsis sp. JB363]